MRTALSIAGSSTCTGAGIQADIKRMMNGVLIMSSVNGLKGQNTAGVTGISETISGCFCTECMITAENQTQYQA